MGCIAATSLSIKNHTSDISISSKALADYGEPRVGQRKLKAVVRTLGSQFETPSSPLRGIFIYTTNKL